LLDEAFFEDFFIAEPQIGDIGGAEPEDILERTAHFVEMKIDADALKQFDERLRAHGLDGPGTDTVVGQPMIGDYVDGMGTGSMTVDVKEAPGFGLGWGEPRCYT